MDPNDLQSQADDHHSNAGSASSAADEHTSQAHTHELAAAAIDDPIEQVRLISKAEQLHRQAADAQAEAAQHERAAAEAEKAAAARKIELEQQANERDREASATALTDDMQAYQMSLEADELRRRAAGI